MQKTKTAYTEDSHRIALHYQTMAQIKTHAGLFEEAETYYSRCIELITRDLGDHIFLVPPLNELGRLALKKGDYSSAKKLFEHALSIARSTFGSKHKHYGSLLNQLGNVSLTVGDLDQAEVLFLESLEILEPIFGPYHLNTTMTFNNLGSVWLKRKEYKTANKWYLRAVEQSRLAAELPAEFRTMLANLCLTFRRLENDTELLECYTELVDLYEPDHPVGLRKFTRMARVQANLGHWAAAHRTASQALYRWRSPEFLEDKYNETWQANSLQTLGEALIGLGQSDEALQHLREALAIRDRLTSDPKRTEKIEKIQVQIKRAQELLDQEQVN